MIDIPTDPAKAAELEERAKAAIAAMGTRWVHYPEYRFDPRHSPNPDLYMPEREKYLAGIRKTAAAERQRRNQPRSTNRSAA